MSEHQDPRERDIVELIRAIDEPAPERLRRRVTEMADGAGSPRRRGVLTPLRVRATLAGATLAAAIAALVLALGGSGPGGGPSLQAATALTLRPATMAAPAESASAKGQLDAAVDGVAFPYWADHFGWRSTGERRDELDGRLVRTVFYAGAGGERIGYAILSGTPAIAVHGGAVRRRGGTAYRLLSQSGVSIVTWVRGGHRCVVSGRGVSTATLLRLASWDDARSA